MQQTPSNSGPTTGQPTGQATGQNIGQTASQTSSQSGSGGTDSPTGEIKSDAKQLGTKAADRIHSEVDARKDTAVTQVQSVSSAIEKTAGELGDDSPQWLKSALQTGAQQIQRFADSIEQKDSRQLMSDAQTFARDNPGTFLAACAAAGFAAARVFKAGTSQSQSGTQQPGQWDSSVQVSSPTGSAPQSTRTNSPGEYV